MRGAHRQAAAPLQRSAAASRHKRLCSRPFAIGMARVPVLDPVWLRMCSLLGFRLIWFIDRAVFVEWD